MPERPDLEYQVPLLDAALRGRTFTGVKLVKAVVWRSASPPAVLAGRQVREVRRHGHFVHFLLSEGHLVVHPMLAGRFSFEGNGHLALSLSLDDGRTLRYRDSEQMGKVYFVSEVGEIPAFAVGPDVLDLSLADFRVIVKKRRDQVKVFLLDKATLDSFGNAYADEVLFDAGIHPKTMVSSLSPDDVGRLHASMVRVLTDARDEIRRRAPPLQDKVRDFLKVRNRAGEPCVRCGTKIRAAGVHGHDAFFCPKCQPDRAGRGIVDWRKLAR